jgi:enediyne biosynthesis protein E4
MQSLFLFILMPRKVPFLNNVSPHSLLCRITFLGFVMLVSCTEQKQPVLFELIELMDSGIDFENVLPETDGLDVFRYRNYYNGAGVGIADLTGNGFPDIYLVSNHGPNRLFKNHGDFRFEDITEYAGVAGTKPWSSGVAIADVNGDGFPDIYVINAGNVPPEQRANELFINNGDGTFTESAAEYGLADTGYGIHAAFFDFDQDGNLDCYVLNNSPVPISSLPLVNIREERDEHGGDRLYHNQHGVFNDVSEKMGIYGSIIGFGLDITLLDANNDGWTDIYISNDFFERDYLYINREGKYFSEELENYIDATSHASMGADAADLNNNGLPDIFTTEMLPENMERRKRMIRYEPRHFFMHKKRQGFYHLFMRNSLQLNNGNNSFSEIGRYANVSATDWSWAALIFDMDNDSRKEIFVTNGIYKDLIDQDFLEFFGSEENLRSAREGSEAHLRRFVDEMPSTPVSNYAFKSDSVMQFSDFAENWGLDTPSFSSGAAFGDLNNDGNRDLVVNNVNGKPFIYKNNSRDFFNHHYLALHLEGKGNNTSGIGAKIVAYTGELAVTEYHYPHRGFLSTSDDKIILGLGKAARVDSLHVYWNALEMSRFYHLPVDTTLHITQTGLEKIPERIDAEKPIFTRIPFDYSHRENDYTEFTHGNLMYHMLSADGPAVAKADLNGDGHDDFFIGGATSFPGALFMSNGNGTYRQISTPVFEQDSSAEDVDAVFFDANNNGLLDLYVVSGGNEYPGNLKRFADRLYLLQGFENGDPVYIKSNGLPELYTSGCCVRPADIDGDGNTDLFIGTRSVPGRYGQPAGSHLLKNDGQGNFTDVTARYIPQLNNIGMVTDAVWEDYDGNGRPDLIIVGDWMPLVIFENRGEFFQRKYSIEGIQHTEGWWKSIRAADLTGNGLPDFIAGNLGTNSMFRATSEKPLRLYINDFERNGFQDYIYAYQYDGEYYPYHNKHDLSDQIGIINDRFTTHADYADQPLNGIFTPDELSSSRILEASLLESVVFINKGDDTFEVQKLPWLAQLSPVFDIAVDDFDNDGKEEILLVGNFSGTKPEEGFYDANHGQFYKIGPDGTLIKANSLNSQLRLRGDVRRAELLRSGDIRYLLIGKNNDVIEIYSYQDIYFNESD